MHYISTHFTYLLNQMKQKGSPVTEQPCDVLCEVKSLLSAAQVNDLQWVNELEGH